MKNDSVIIDRKQIFLLFFSSIVIMILIFGVGVLLGKKLSAVSVTCDNPDQVISRSEKVQEKNVAGKEVIKDAGIESIGSSVVVQQKKEEEANIKKVETTQKKSENLEKEKSVNRAVSNREEQPKKVEKKVETPKAVAKVESEKEPKKGSEVVDAKFTLQVGAFPDRSQALKIAAELEKKGYESWIQRGKSKDKDIFRVRIGKFATKSDAEKFKQQFDKKEKYNSFITPLE